MYKYSYLSLRNLHFTVVTLVTSFYKTHTHTHTHTQSQQQKKKTKQKCQQNHLTLIVFCYYPNTYPQHSYYWEGVDSNSAILIRAWTFGSRLICRTRIQRCVHSHALIELPSSQRPLINLPSKLRTAPVCIKKLFTRGVIW